MRLTFLALHSHLLPAPPLPNPPAFKLTSIKMSSCQFVSFKLASVQIASPNAFFVNFSPSGLPLPNLSRSHLLSRGRLFFIGFTFIRFTCQPLHEVFDSTNSIRIQPAQWEDVFFERREASGVSRPKDCACCASMISLGHSSATRKQRRFFSPLPTSLPQFFSQFFTRRKSSQVISAFLPRPSRLLPAFLKPSRFFSICKTLPTACLNSSQLFSAFRVHFGSIVSICLNFFRSSRHLQ